MLVRIRAVSDALPDADQAGVFFFWIAYHEDCKAHEWLWEKYQRRLEQKRGVYFLDDATREAGINGT